MLVRKRGSLQLLTMSAVKSIKNAMGWEQREVERWSNADYAAVHGGNAAASPCETEDMENWVGGDQKIEHHYHQSAPPSSGLSTLGKVAVGASLLAGGAGAGVVANQVLSDDKPAAVAGDHVDTDTLTDVTFPE